MKENPYDKTILIRLTAPQMERFRELVAASGLSASAFCRSRLGLEKAKRRKADPLTGQEGPGDPVADVPLATEPAIPLPPGP